MQTTRYRLTFTVRGMYSRAMGSPTVGQRDCRTAERGSRPQTARHFPSFPRCYRKRRYGFCPIGTSRNRRCPTRGFTGLEKTVIPDGPDYIPPSLIPYGAVLSFYIGGRRHTGRITHVDIRAESTLLRYFITVASIPLAEQYGLTDREGEELIDRGGEILLPRGHSIPPDDISGLTLTGGVGEIDVELGCRISGGRQVPRNPRPGIRRYRSPISIMGGRELDGC